MIERVAKYLRYLVPLVFLGAFLSLASISSNFPIGTSSSVQAAVEKCGGTHEECPLPRDVKIEEPKYCTRDVNCRQHDVCDRTETKCVASHTVCDKRDNKNKCIKSHDVCDRTETKCVASHRITTCDKQTYQCGTTTKTEKVQDPCKQVPNPPCPPPSPTCQNDPGCNAGAINNWDCVGTNQYKVCNRINDCYKWTQTFPCGGTATRCSAGQPGSCEKNPNESQGVIVSDKCFRLTAGFGRNIGISGNSYLTVGENTEFSLRWDPLWPNVGCPYPPTNCVKWGTQMNGGWQGQANRDGGQLGPFSFSGQSNVSFDDQGILVRPHNFQIGCNGVPASNPVTVGYQREKAQPQPPTCIPCNNPGQASKSCINSDQWQECVLQDGKNCLATFSCSQFPGTTCSNPGGYCVGKPVGPNPDKGCTSNANCPSGTTCEVTSGRCIVSDTHAECQNGSCVSVSGPGANQCTSSLNCITPPTSHLECRNNSCASVTGPGISDCTSVGSSCNVFNSTHLECQNNSCTVVPNAGVNQCSPEGSSCVPSPCVGPECDGGGGGGGGGCVGPSCPVFGSTQCYDDKDNDGDGKMNYKGGFLGGKWLPPDPDCSSFNDNSESPFKIKEIIPDFFNLNWFKINVANFFKVEALGKQ